MKVWRIGRICAAVLLTSTAVSLAQVAFDFEPGSGEWSSYGAIELSSGIMPKGSVGQGRFVEVDFDQKGFGVAAISPAGVDFTGCTGMSVDARFVSSGGSQPFSGTPQVDFMIALGLAEWSTTLDLTNTYQTYTVDFSDLKPNGDAKLMLFNGDLPKLDDPGLKIQLVVRNSIGTGVGRLEYDQIRLTGRNNGSTLLERAVDLDTEGRYREAAVLYDRILAANPKDQEVAVRRAASLLAEGRVQEALSGVDAAIALDQHSGEWAEQALLYKARICQTAGCAVDARNAIALLKSRFPDSLATAEAEVVEAELDGVDATSASNALASEKAAKTIRDDAEAAVRAKDFEGALALYQQVADGYPQTRQALLVRERKAALLGELPGRMEEAVVELRGLLDEVKQTAPQSRIRYEAEYRIEDLYKLAHVAPFAMDRYDKIAATATDPSMISDAMWQAADAHFEVLYQRKRDGEAVGSADWAALRARCDRVRNLGYAKERELARADYLTLLAYHWDGSPADALRTAEAFISTYDENTYAKDAAIARLVAGEALQALGRHAEALAHFQWVVAEFGDKGSWPNRMCLNRAYFDIHYALWGMGAPLDQVLAAGKVVLAKCPDSTEADLVRRALSQLEP